MEKQQISIRVTWLSLAIGAACLGCGREPPTPATHGITSTPSAHEAATGAGPSRADDGLSPEMVEQREQLIVTLRRAGISDERVLDAIARVPRHELVPRAQRPYAYEDRPLPIGQQQTISQPYIVALMTELARVGPEDRVLEIGTGSGYQAAVLAKLAQEVYTIEIVESLATAARRDLERLGLAKNVRFRVGDGYAGWPEAAPFDAIVVTAAPPEIPEPLQRQLKVGGRLVIPVGVQRQDLRVLEKTEKGLEESTITPVRFVPMTGRVQQP